MIGSHIWGFSYGCCFINFLLRSKKRIAFLILLLLFFLFLFVLLRLNCNSLLCFSSRFIFIELFFRFTRSRFKAKFFLIRTTIASSSQFLLWRHPLSPFVRIKYQIKVILFFFIELFFLLFQSFRILTERFQIIDYLRLCLIVQQLHHQTRICLFLDISRIFQQILRFRLFRFFNCW